MGINMKMIALKFDMLGFKKSYLYLKFECLLLIVVLFVVGLVKNIMGINMKMIALKIDMLGLKKSYLYLKLEFLLLIVELFVVRGNINTREP
jgi:uncharacterized membrane protein